MAIKPIIKGHIFINLDFDGTITTDQDDNFGEYTLQPNCKQVLKALHDTGKVHFGIWSCRSEPQMKTAKAFLRRVGLYDLMEHFNGDFKELVELYETPNRKSSADIYIDDRASWGVINWLDIYYNVMVLLNEMEE